MEMDINTDVDTDHFQIGDLGCRYTKVRNKVYIDFVILGFGEITKARYFM
jgi:hypothetical protein